MLADAYRYRVMGWDVHEVDFVGGHTLAPTSVYDSVLLSADEFARLALRRKGAGDCRLPEVVTSGTPRSRPRTAVLPNRATFFSGCD